MRHGVSQLLCLLIAAQTAKAQGDTLFATLHGKVLSSDRRPISGARVSVTGHDPATTDREGSWVVNNVPRGRRILDVRVIGFKPVSRVVDAFVDTVAIEIVLSPLVPELAEVEVVAAVDKGSGFAGFEARQRSGYGRYITESDIRRRAIVVTSDLFRSLPGIQKGTRITMRGAFGDCSPSLYLDGKLMTSSGSLTPADLDALVKPEDILGIEIYYDVPPPQFQPALTGCGSIVIWTK